MRVFRSPRQKGKSNPPFVNKAVRMTRSGILKGGYRGRGPGGFPGDVAQHEESGDRAPISSSHILATISV
jgi:hypothetical protein